MKPLKSNNLDKHLVNTISYFSFFGYPPSLSEIHTFFPIKIAKVKLEELLKSLLRQKKLISYKHAPSHSSSPSNFLLSRVKSRDLFARNDNIKHSSNLKRSSFQIKNFKFQIKN